MAYFNGKKILFSPNVIIAGLAMPKIATTTADSVALTAELIFGEDGLHVLPTHDRGIIIVTKTTENVGGTSAMYVVYDMPNKKIFTWLIGRTSASGSDSATIGEPIDWEAETYTSFTEAVLDYMVGSSTRNKTSIGATYDVYDLEIPADVCNALLIDASDEA